MNSQKYFPITNRKPEEVIAYHSDHAVRVDQFLFDAIALSKHLPTRRYVFNLFTDRYQYLLGFCASVIAGQCTLMPPNRLAKTIGQLSEEYPDSYSLGDPDLPAGKTSKDSSSHKPFASASFAVPTIPGDQLCAIAFTSGSTGKPMPNLRYWQTIRTGSVNNAGLLLKEETGHVNLLATVPPQHMWGFETSILMPLFANVAISQLTPFYPKDIVEALESLAAPRALISSPTHLRILLKSGVKTPKINRIFSATAPLTRDLAKELERCFKTRVFEIFGSSETGILAFRKTATESLWQLSELFELDVKTDGFLIRGQHLPEQVFLQDVIEKVNERQFRWLGRYTDLVNIAGKRGLLTDLNCRLLAIEGVVDGVIFKPDGNTERLAAMVVAPGLAPAAILGKLRLEIDSVFLPRPVYMVPALPRQETGKLAHQDMMSLYVDIARKKKLNMKKQ